MSREWIKRVVQMFGCACIVGSTATPAATVDAVEFYHHDFNHYFITAFPEEAAALDSGTVVKGWSRTGRTFKVEGSPVANQSAVCRFFSTSFAPKSSHFYTADTAECATVKTNESWQFEAVAFYGKQPDTAGNCPVGTLSVYRLYNNGASGAPNHRYTTDRATRGEMLSQGWVPEGYGEGVVLCTSPSPPSLALCVISGIFNTSCDATTIPYTSSGTLQASVLGSSSVTVESFRLTVADAPVTITELTAIDLNGVATARVSGLALGQQIQPGQTISFSLVSGLTGGRQANLRFAVRTSGNTLVDVTYLVLTN